MNCEICGKETTKLYKIEIEGSTLNVCSECNSSNAEELIEEPKQTKIKRILPIKKNEKFEDFELVEDFGLRIRNARQKLGLTFKELGQKVFEKESVLQKIELNKMKPDLKLVERLEKVLNIKLKEKTD